MQYCSFCLLPRSSPTVRSVNGAIIETNWRIGQYIVEYEQEGRAKAGYGKALQGLGNFKWIIATFAKPLRPLRLDIFTAKCAKKIRKECNKAALSLKARISLLGARTSSQKRGRRRSEPGMAHEENENLCSPHRCGHSERGFFRFEPQARRKKAAIPRPCASPFGFAVNLRAPDFFAGA
jgi:hypothetical protein